jgi:hypothetical protein
MMQGERAPHKAKAAAAHTRARGGSAARLTQESSSSGEPRPQAPTPGHTRQRLPVRYGRPAAVVTRSFLKSFPVSFFCARGKKTLFVVYECFSPISRVLGGA